MKRFLSIITIVAIFVSGLFVGQTHAVISEVSRCRIIADLIKDGTVANETPYASIDMATGALVTKYANAFWTVYDGKNTAVPGTVIDAPTNAQGAAFVLKRLRMHMHEVLEASRVPQIGVTAAATEKTTIAAEVATDLGT